MCYVYMPGSHGRLLVTPSGLWMFSEKFCVPALMFFGVLPFRYFPAVALFSFWIWQDQACLGVLYLVDFGGTSKILREGIGQHHKMAAILVRLSPCFVKEVVFCFSKIKGGFVPFKHIGIISKPRDLMPISVTSLRAGECDLLVWYCPLL